ncbi:hypothetical protein CERSUDRAFT_77484 [Gelatoporia subvermispora B]|uniref:Uncharacterized protein n=1 Tax=Ceriporiopsis subvermispora (strain B) TaxID=914234 RepID=M2Q6P5_CERS8|nr:hypothetical protein CERSUDRAFT_77484 [Gelatoporia subvermispora B]
MVGRRWTTDAELAYLKDNEDAFLDAQTKDVLPDFWPTLYSGWFRLWPEIDRQFPGQGLKECDLDVAQRAKLKEATETRHGQLRSWYTNNTVAKLKRRAAKTAAKPVAVISTKGSRGLQQAEMFSSLYYDEKVQGIVDTILTSEQKQDVNQIRRVTRAVFEGESDEVKAEVSAAVQEQREARRKLKELRKSGQRVPPTPREKQEALRTAPDEIDAFFRDLAFRTDWSYTCVGGGPVPTGKDVNTLRSINYHIGKDPSGYAWEDVYSGYEEHVSGPYGDFIKDVYVNRINLDASTTRTNATSRAPLPVLSNSDLDVDLPNDENVDEPRVPAGSTSRSKARRGRSGRSEPKSKAPTPVSPTSPQEHTISTSVPNPSVTSTALSTAPDPILSTSSAPPVISASAAAQISGEHLGSLTTSSAGSGVPPPSCSDGSVPHVVCDEESTIQTSVAHFASSSATTSLMAPVSSTMADMSYFHIPMHRHPSSSDLTRYTAVTSSDPLSLDGAQEMDVDDPLAEVVDRHPSFAEFLGPELDPTCPHFQSSTYLFQFGSVSLLDELAFATSQGIPTAAPITSSFSGQTASTAISDASTSVALQPASTPVSEQTKTSALRSTCGLDDMAPTSALRSTCGLGDMSLPGGDVNPASQLPQLWTFLGTPASDLTRATTAPHTNIASQLPQTISGAPLSGLACAASGNVNVGLGSSAGMVVTLPHPENHNENAILTSQPLASRSSCIPINSTTSVSSPTGTPDASVDVESIHNTSVQQEPLAAQGCSTQLGTLANSVVQTGASSHRTTPPPPSSSHFSDSSSSRAPTPRSSDIESATPPPTTPRSSSACSTRSTLSSVPDGLPDNQTQDISSGTPSRRASPSPVPVGERPRRELRAPKRADYYYAESTRHAQQPHVSIVMPEREPMKWLEDAKGFLFSIQMESEFGRASTMSRLGAAEHRPEELTKWFTSGRNYKKLPTVQNTKTYGISWLAWWRALQPQWRASSIAPSSSSLPPAIYEDPSNDWKTLKKCRPTGFVILLVGLALWAQASPRASREWKRALQDVYQCLRHFVPNSAKRPTLVALERAPKKQKNRK